MNWIFAVGKWAASFLVGGSLDRILDTIENKMDNETKKEEIKAEVTKTWINAQTQLLVGRTWWFQLFFVLPAGAYWATLLYVSAAPPFMPVWEVHRLPGWSEEIYLAIVSALFIVDGGKALLNKLKGK